MKIEENPGVMPMLETMIFRSFLRHDFAHNILHLPDQFVGQFNPRAGRRFEIDDELAGIGAREIGFADERIERQGSE